MGEAEAKEVNDLTQEAGASAASEGVIQKGTLHNGPGILTNTSITLANAAQDDLLYFASSCCASVISALYKVNLVKQKQWVLFMTV